MSTITNSPLRVSVVRLPHGNELPLPDFATEQAAGMDLYAAVEKPMPLEAGSRALIPTGLAMALPPGFEAQIRPRSGLAARYGITVINAPGTIDADYRGEVRVALVNLGHEPFIIERGCRIAQMVFAPVLKVCWKEVQTLPDTHRGAGGFGSTGLALEKTEGN